MNMGRVPPPFWENKQLQNEFPNSCFARMLDWERAVILNHGNRRWDTAWTQMNPECNWDDIFLDQPPIFYNDEQILGVVTTRSWMVLHIHNMYVCHKIHLMWNKTLTGFHAPNLHAVPLVRLKLPMLMGTNLHVCGREANQNSVTMPGLKVRIQKDVLQPKNGLRSHLRASNFVKFRVRDW